METELEAGQAREAAVILPPEIPEKALRKSRGLYIAEAALEYLISILVAGSFLATLTQELGFSDSLTGILSSVISLGAVFQLLSIFIHRRRMKGLVILLSVFNQALFMLLYVIPLLGGGRNLKTILFIVTIFLAYLIYYIAHPKKTYWLMSLVEDGRRGRFTAAKEVVSLIAGMVFTYGMGALIDHFHGQGDLRTAFLLCGGTIFILMAAHTLTMLFSVEKGSAETPRKAPMKNMADVFRDKRVKQVAIAFMLWSLASFSAIPFYGTYQINELGFSLKLVSVLIIVSSIARILVSRFWGAYADKAGFAAMIQLCFLVMAFGFLVNTFTTPANGIVLFTLFMLCFGIAQGGINSALTNLVFDYVTPERRADSLALSQAVSGIVGFLATLAMSFLVAHIQKNGNHLLGISVYAQQVTSFIAFIFTAVAIVYVHFALCEPKQRAGG